MGDGIMWGRFGLKIYIYIMLFLMLLPFFIVLPVSLTKTSYLAFPPQGITLKWFIVCFQDRILVESLILSLKLAAISSALVVTIALMAGMVIERNQFRGKIFLETFLTSPRIVPVIILVIGLLIFYYSIGLAESFTGLVFSHLVITIPFAFRTVLASVVTLDVQLEWAAKTLGANWFAVFFRIILPQIKTGMIAAFLFSFISSFNNVTMALFLSAPGQRTLPVELFNRLHIGGITPTTPAISFLLALMGVILFIVLDRTLGIYKYLAGAKG